MNLETPLQTLKFLWLKWPISQVEGWLNYPTPGLDYFLFDFYFAGTKDHGTPLGLCVFAHNTKPGYFNSLDPDILEPFEDEALVLNGPIKLTSNMISVEVIKSLLPPDPAPNEFLLFTPSLNDDNQVFYTVTVGPAGTKMKGGPGGFTNPSPPA